MLSHLLAVAALLPHCALLCVHACCIMTAGSYTLYVSVLLRKACAVEQGLRMAMQIRSTPVQAASHTLCALKSPAAGHLLSLQGCSRGSTHVMLRYCQHSGLLR